MNASFRPLLLRLHRAVGLSLAGFLVVAGLTGSVAAFHDELDGWLNPDLFRARTAGPPLPPSALVARLEAADPRVRLGYVVYRPPAGQAVRAFVRPRIDPATHAAFPLVRNELFLDPVTGAIQGRRSSDGCCLGRHTAIPFLYRLHYTLGLGWAGRWLMGIVAIVWSADCVVGLLLTLPKRARPWRGADWRRWAPAWRIAHDRGFPLAFDLHRAVSLWLWLVLLGVAISGVALALPFAVFRPVVTAILPVTPPPAAAGPASGTTIGLDRADAIAAGAARSIGWRGRPNSLFAVPEAGTLTLYFAGPNGGRAAGLGAPVVTLDASSGRVLAIDRPDSGRAGDLLLRLQLPWHGGQLAGLAGRIAIAVTGLAVPMLVVTGVVIWNRKRRARRVHDSKARGSAPGPRQRLSLWKPLI